MRGRSALRKQFATAGIGARSTAYPFRPAVNGPSVRVPSGRAMRYPLTRGTRELASEKL